MYDSVKRHPRTQVVVVDEFRTSKLCPLCHQPLEFPKTRFTLCRRCKKTFNRDSGAAQNILQNGVHQVNQRVPEDDEEEANIKSMKGEFSESFI